MLCTQADVEKKLQWDITADPDPTVTALIAAAQSHIEAEVGRPLESDTREETFDGGYSAIFLSVWPVTEVTTVTEDGTTLTATDYGIKSNGRLIRLSGDYRTFWRGYKPQSIVVEYTGGYLAGTHDSELEHLGSICSEVVARAFRRGADSAAIAACAAGAVQSVSLAGSDSVTYATGGEAEFPSLGNFVFLTEEERRQLGRYRRFTLGIA